MANTNRALDVLGVDVDKRDTTPEFQIGTTCWGANGDQYMYVQANGAIAASQTDITVSAAGQASDGLGSWENSATAFADNEYGWVWLNRAA